MLTISFIAPLEIVDCLDYGMPFKTRDADDSFFIFHQSLAKVQRKRIVSAFNLSASESKLLYDEGNALADRGLGEIVNILAPNLPLTNIYVGYGRPEGQCRHGNCTVAWVWSVIITVLCVCGAAVFMLYAKKKYATRSLLMNEEEPIIRK